MIPAPFCRFVFVGLFSLTVISCDANQSQNSSSSKPLAELQAKNKTLEPMATRENVPASATKLADVNPKDMELARQSFTKMLQERAQVAGQKFDPSMIKSIRATPLTDWYQVYLGGKDLVYIHKDGQHMMQGDLINFKTEENITQRAIDELSKINFRDLPLNQAITWVNGKKTNPKYEIAVFADPNCGYCKRFEQSVQNIDGLTLHTYIIPILSEDSQTKATHILCAKDPVQAWRNDMLYNESPEKIIDKNCQTKAENTLIKNRQLAQKYGVTSTPHIFLLSGHNMPGAMPPERLISLLENNPLK